MKKLNKILAIEDDEDMRTLLQFSLEILGHYRLMFCSSTEVDEQAIKKFKPDLILLDGRQLEIENFKIFSAVKKISAVPIIFFVDKIEPNSKLSYKKMGAFKILRKPFDPMTLEEKLQKFWLEYQQDTVFTE